VRRKAGCCRPAAGSPNRAQRCEVVEPSAPPSGWGKAGRTCQDPACSNDNRQRAAYSLGRGPGTEILSRQFAPERRRDRIIRPPFVCRSATPAVPVLSRYAQLSSTETLSSAAVHVAIRTAEQREEPRDDAASTASSGKRRTAAILKPQASNKNKPITAARGQVTSRRRRARNR